jgi:hypothetical protein
MIKTININDVAVMSVETRIQYLQEIKPWAAGLVLSVGDYVNVGGYSFKVTTAGTTGTTEPVIPKPENVNGVTTVTTVSITDGTAVYAPGNPKPFEGTPVNTYQYVTYYELDENGDPIGDIKGTTYEVSDQDVLGTVAPSTAGRSTKARDHANTAREWAKAKVVDKIKNGK